MAGAIILQGQLTNIAAGTFNVGPFTISPNTGNNFSVTSVTALASGANTITVPSWASGVIINPSTANAVGMTLKGVTGDTGLPLGLINPTLINFPASPPASFVITAASLFTTVTEFIFF